MKTFSIGRKMKPINNYISIVAFSVFGCSLSATELYNLDFTSNDVGTYQVVFGNPTVQSSVGPFSSALVFQPQTSLPGYDQIELPINTASPSYDIQYDVLVHDLLGSPYYFEILLDTPEVRTVSLDGSPGAVDVFQPSPYTLESVAGFSNDQAYHFDVYVDLQANLWSLSIDGVQVFANPLNASSLEDIRFSMAPGASGITTAYAALDNVVVSVVPEPTVFNLLIATLPLLLCHRQKQLVPAA